MKISHDLREHEASLNLVGNCWVYKDEYRIPTKSWIMQLIECLIGD